MKKLFILLSVFNYSLLFGQFDCTQIIYEFEDSSCFNQIIIDNIYNPNNQWQIGKPNKQVFDSAYSYSNVIVTDTVTPYTSNNTSVFVVKKLAYTGFTWPHTAYLEGYYFVHSDSLKDYGQIEFSPDNGVTWINLLTDSIYLSPWSWESPKPTFTGNSNGWQRFHVDLTAFGPAFDIQLGDTIQYKFSFISDSIPNTMDGLMFDDLIFDDIAEGINEENITKSLIKLYPNPATDLITMESIPMQSTIEIYNIQGQIILQKQVQQGKTDIDISRFAKGVYILKFLSNDRTEVRRIEKE